MEALANGLCILIPLGLAVCGTAAIATVLEVVAICAYALLASGRRLFKPSLLDGFNPITARHQQYRRVLRRWHLTVPVLILLNLAPYLDFAAFLPGQDDVADFMDILMVFVCLIAFVALLGQLPFLPAFQASEPKQGKGGDFVLSEQPLEEE